jgi:choline dehydrogenase-like flavoprotein
MLPFEQADIRDWPISIADLKPHYDAASDIAGLRNARDGLADAHAPSLPERGELRLSNQARAMWERLRQNRATLNERGIFAGRAQVAIKTELSEPDGCRYCGMCLQGCPYDYIYSAEQTLTELKQHAALTYTPDFVVTRIEETSDEVTVRGYHRVTKEPLAATASRVLLAGGVIPTSSIILRSGALYDQPVVLKDSQYFIFPAALLRQVPGVRDERLHTLSQLFIEMLDPAVDERWVHLQVYSYSSIIRQAIADRLGAAARRLDYLAQHIERRMMVIQGYLHSDVSGRLMLNLSKAHGDETLSLQPVENPLAKAVIRKAIAKLLRNSLQIGAVPVSALATIADVGRGFHVGGSFPMSRQPSGLQADTLGRPLGWKRVHAVDATVFPSVPAMTITLTVMANAHRIGTEVAKLDG